MVIGTHKAWAYPTRREAMESLVIRTRWRCGYAREALEKACAVEDMLKEHYPELTK